MNISTHLSITNFYVEKSSDLFADTLNAHGFAFLLDQILERGYGVRGRGSLRIRDCGGYFQLTCEHPISDEVLAAASNDPLRLFPAIQTSKNAESLSALPYGWSLAYEALRDQRNIYLSWLDSLPNTEKAQVIRGESSPQDAPPPPDPHWDILRAVNPLALPGWNNLATNWYTAQGALPDLLRFLLETYSTMPNDLANAEERWKELDTAYGWDIKSQSGALQLFNPSQGKGQNRSKANGLSMGNVNAFWLVEALKVTGFYEIGVTRRLTTDDRKSYVIAPVDVGVASLDQVMGRFGRDMVGREGSIRSDVLAAIRFTRALLTYAQENETSSLWAQIMGGSRPRDIVSGFHTVFYKNLGNADAAMNLSFIALPGWVTLQGGEDVSALVALLEEHEKIARQFDESHNDGFNLLLAYRDFLSGDDAFAFLDFAVSYASFLIGRRERGLFTYQFSTEHIGRLVMSMEPAFTNIVQNEGFQNVAYAIRQSTVTAQYRKAQGDRRYDIRYGLHHDLSRAANRKDAFITALGDFMAKYNAENAQVMETRPGPYRTSLYTNDIEEIVRLVDEYGSEVVAKLLIAYGYARASYDQNEEVE